MTRCDVCRGEVPGLVEYVDTRRGKRGHEECIVNLSRIPLTNEDARCCFGDRCDICNLAPEAVGAEAVLSEAQRLISTDRNDSYGPFAEDFGRTVAIFNAWTGHNLTVADGIRFMRAVKMSREIASPLRDNLVDGAGYIGGQAQVEGFDAG